MCTSIYGTPLLFLCSSFPQIVLRPAVNTTFAVDVQSAGANLKITWEQVGFVYVSEILNNSQGGAGWWPDPCLRVPRAMATGGVATSLWFTVRALPETPSGTYTTTITLTPSNGGDAIHVPISVTVFGFSLPTKPAALTAFNLDAAKVASVYGHNYSATFPLSVVETMWYKTGCSNNFSATVGEQSLWQHSADGGANDMYSYCTLTKAGTATPGQRAVCGTVPSKCMLQSPPSGYDPTIRPGHDEVVRWARWLLANFSLNPGSIYSPPVPFTVEELSAMVPLGLNSFTAFKAETAYATDPNIAKYVMTHTIIHASWPREMLMIISVR